MDYKQINDKTIKISLTFDDLKEHNVKMSDFLVNQGMVEKLFYELISELDIEDKFANTGMMTFQVRPHPKGVDLLVTEEFNMDNMPFSEDAEGLQEMMNEAMGQMGDMANMIESLQARPNFDLMDSNSDYVYFILKFNKISEAVKMSQAVIDDVEESELFEFDGKFYLTILDNQKRKGAREVSILRTRMLEYGASSDFSRETLLEHGVSIFREHALENLQRI
ncbi:adapter protein MecA [Lactococcus hodotermopsidis]|uniref:Adapter protein MecA n=1 Tax=Pseudolactococcus hodotermopsidis TaxID=2709157 RepID=A0A6A0BFS2_9LACT|nr:adaptor protein MecA [Lactococcus hodotermopsidis]GFH43121.1 adapter protein MecA [Lactococcus hodotermopsidis]